MATTVRPDNAKVGMVVYESHKPLNPGYVENVRGKKALLRWKKDPTNPVWTDLIALKCFDSLIADHERKLVGHKITRRELKEVLTAYENPTKSKEIG